MIITKYMKKNNGKYDVFLEDGRVLSLYEEVILEYNLLLNKIISLDSILEIEKHNQKWEVYYYALKQLNRKAFSTEDLKLYLLHKEYPLSLVEDIINKLVEQGYLNDLVFARSYIHQQMITSLKGPLKIKQELYNKKISSDIIEREIDVFVHGGAVLVGKEMWISRGPVPRGLLRSSCCGPIRARTRGSRWRLSRPSPSLSFAARLP